MNRQYRQGDVFLNEITTKPETRKEIPLDEGATVLAYGEVTGHKHQIRDKRARQYETEGTYPILEIKSNQSGELLEQTDDLMKEIDSVLLTHEEHEAIEVPASTYERRIQQEWDYFAGFRDVLD